MSKEIVVPVVIDTNVLVPSVYRSTHLLSFLLSGNLLLVWNRAIHDEAKEIADRLWEWYRRKIDGIRRDRDETFDLLDLVFQLGFSVPPMPDTWPAASSDRDDDPFLWVASKGGAEYIISHDKRHMIKLGTFAGIPIGNAKCFFDWVNSVHPMSGNDST